MTPLEPFESALPSWMRDSLRDTRDDVSSNAMTENVMTAVRAEARRSRGRRVPSMQRRFDWRRRGVLSPVGGMLTTLMLAAVVMLRIDVGHSDSLRATAYQQIIGDSVVPASPTAEHEGRWLDTLRIVELVLRAPGVRTASALGDFNQWQRSATPLARVATAEWRTRVLVPRDALPDASRMAVLVNDRELVPAAAR